VCQQEVHQAEVQVRRRRRLSGLERRGGLQQGTRELRLGGIQVGGTGDSPKNATASFAGATPASASPSGTDVISNKTVKKMKTKPTVITPWPGRALPTSTLAATALASW
jgi:hypothetical protein